MLFNTFPAPFVETASGAYFTDVDGHSYLDMNVADMSMCTGYAAEPVVEAINARMAAGHQFLLPTEDAIVVSEKLSERFGLPFWQYTLSASTANTEAIRLARSYTGKEKVLLFDGKYHGHIDATLVALNNGVNIVEGAGLPSHCTDTADIVQFNDLNATESALKNGNIACIMSEPALTNCGVIMPEEFSMTTNKQDWGVHRLYCRSGYTCASPLPRNVLEMDENFDPLLADCQRIFMANRGIWEAITTVGPTVSIAARKDDVDFYLGVFEQFLSSLID